MSQYACYDRDSGCYGVCVDAEPVETIVAETLFEIVDSPDFGRQLAVAQGRPPALRDELEEIERRMAELAEMWAERYDAGAALRRASIDAYPPRRT